MKKTVITAMLIGAALSLTSCKKEGKVVELTQEVVETNVLETTTEEATAKQKVEKEKEQLTKPYSETEDAQAKLDELIAQAKVSGKRVFVQAGGNWCIWCLRFNDFVQQNEELKAVVDANYYYYHLNYSKENKNKAVFEQYAPEGMKLGFPFFFVIDGEGTVTNVFASGDLEANKSYDVEKVKQMFLANAATK